MDNFTTDGVEPAEPAFKPVSAKAFYFFMFIAGMQGLISKLVGFFIPLYFDGLGFSGVQTGIYFTFASIATIILSLPMGVSTDKKPIAYIFMLSFLLAALSYTGLLFFESFIIFCMFAFLGSFGTRFFVTGREAMFFKITDRNSPVKASHFNMIVMSFTGFGMIIGGLIISGFSFWPVFLIAALANIVLMGLSYFIPRTETAVIKLAEYKRELLKPRVLFIIFIFFLTSLHWGAETIAYPRFLRYNFGLEYYEAGLYTGLGFFVVGIGGFIGAFLIKKKYIKNLKNLLIISFLLSGVFHILMCFGNVYQSFIFRCFHEIGDGLTFLVFYFGIPRIFKVQTIGGCAAFISLWMSIGSFSSGILFGYIGDKWGNEWPMIISGIIMAMVPFLILIRQKFEKDII
jgi:MFS family permease